MDEEIEGDVESCKAKADERKIKLSKNDDTSRVKWRYEVKGNYGRNKMDPKTFISRE